jgi:hypothetical protein
MAGSGLVAKPGGVSHHGSLVRLDAPVRDEPARSGVALSEIAVGRVAPIATALTEARDP